MRATPVNLKPWQAVTSADARAAIRGSLLEPMVAVLQSVAVPALPLELTLPKALVLAGCALSQPIDPGHPEGAGDLAFATRRGLDRARVIIETGGGQGCNIWSCIVARSAVGKDIGGLADRVLQANRLMVGNGGSAEGMADALIETGAGVIAVSELMNYLDPHRWEHKATSFLTMAFNAAHVKVSLSKRNGGSRDIPYCLPSILANIQPDVLASASDRNLMNSGFLPRFLFSYCPEGHDWRPTVRAIDWHPMADAFDGYRKMLAKVHVPHDYLQDVLDEFKDGAEFESHWRRLVFEYGPRIAVMLATNPERPNRIKIEEDHWRRAGVLVRWFYGMAERALAGIGDSPKEQEIKRKLDSMLAFIRKHKAGVSRADFSRRFSRGMLAKERNEYIQELIGLGYITTCTRFEREILLAVPGVMQDRA